MAHARRQVRRLLRAARDCYTLFRLRIQDIGVVLRHCVNREKTA
jgi:hypothetical protein